MTETVTIEKQVWESTLNRSKVLEAENTKLKSLLKECRPFVVQVLTYNDDQEQEKTNLLNKINQVLGEE